MQIYPTVPMQLPLFVFQYCVTSFMILSEKVVYIIIVGVTLKTLALEGYPRNKWIFRINCDYLLNSHG